MKEVDTPNVRLGAPLYQTIKKHTQWAITTWLYWCGRKRETDNLPISCVERGTSLLLCMVGYCDAPRSHGRFWSSVPPVFFVRIPRPSGCSNLCKLLWMWHQLRPTGHPAQIGKRRFSIAFAKWTNNERQAWTILLLHNLGMNGATERRSSRARSGTFCHRAQSGGTQLFQPHARQPILTPANHWRCCIHCTDVSPSSRSCGQLIRDDIATRIRRGVSETNWLESGKTRMVRGSVLILRVE